MIIHLITVCLELLGYINEGGDLNLPRLEKYLEKLSENDVESFQNQYADLKWLEGKLGGQEGASRKTKIKLVGLSRCNSMINKFTF